MKYAYLVLITIFVSYACNRGAQQENEKSLSIPFEVFNNFERLEGGDPLLYCNPPEWAAAAHAIVVEDTIHYFWSKRDKDNFWDLRHSQAPVSNPLLVTHDPRNPFLTPPLSGMDSKSMEYPCPFYNHLDDKFYMYYLVKENGPPKHSPKQTGLLVSKGDLGIWERVLPRPVITAEYEHEKIVAGHTSVAIVNDTIQIIYTGWTSWDHNPTICHASAPLAHPEQVTKNANNPVFKGSGEKWDSHGVREAEIFKGPEYYHIFYGGRDVDRVFHIGHVRTKDFETFEANPYNPIFTTASDSSAWDSGGLLTPQVFEAGNYYYMIYAGVKGKNWGKDGHCATGLARAPK